MSESNTNGASNPRPCGLSGAARVELAGNLSGFKDAGLFPGYAMPVREPSLPETAESATDSKESAFLSELPPASYELEPGTSTTLILNEVSETFLVDGKRESISIPRITVRLTPNLFVKPGEPLVYAHDSWDIFFVNPNDMAPVRVEKQLMPANTSDDFTPEDITTLLHSDAKVVAVCNQKTIDTERYSEGMLIDLMVASSEYPEICSTIILEQVNDVVSPALIGPQEPLPDGCLVLGTVLLSASGDLTISAASDNPILACLSITTKCQIKPVATPELSEPLPFSLSFVVSTNSAASPLASQTAGSHSVPETGATLPEVSGQFNDVKDKAADPKDVAPQPLTGQQLGGIAVKVARSAEPTPPTNKAHPAKFSLTNLKKVTRNLTSK